MSILKVARMGNPVLRTKALPMERGDIQRPAFQKFIDDMIDTMNEYRGIGLAAPQVHESLRLVIVGIQRDEDDDDAKMEILPLINPEITIVGKDEVEGWEGCLSIPEVRGRVPRVQEIRVRAYDRKANRMDRSFKGFPARVIQHEADHLDGVLFIDRMRSFESLTYLDEYARYWAHATDEQEV
ncbi:MAG: peptide deformylase [Bacteroidales bacterium]